MRKDYQLCLAFLRVRKVPPDSTCARQHTPTPEMLTALTRAAKRPGTRQSLKVDPRGPAISNLLHPYLLRPRTDRARVTKTENSHQPGRQGTDFDDNL